MRLPKNINKDYFLCEKCHNKNFTKIYNFALRFREVNFSDELIYEEKIEEIYQCTHCKTTYSEKQIDESLKEMINERQKSLNSKEGVRG